MHELAAEIYGIMPQSMLRDLARQQLKIKAVGSTAFWGGKMVGIGLCIINPYQPLEGVLSLIRKEADWPFRRYITRLARGFIADAFEGLPVRWLMTTVIEGYTIGERWCRRLGFVDTCKLADYMGCRHRIYRRWREKDA